MVTELRLQSLQLQAQEAKSRPLKLLAQKSELGSWVSASDFRLFVCFVLSSLTTFDQEKAI